MLRFLVTLSLLSSTLLPAAEVPLTFGPHRDLTLRPQPDTVLDVTLSEGNPHFWTAIVPATYDPAQQTVFALEYFAPSGLQSIILRYRVADGSMAVAESLPAPLAETWQPLAFDLSQLETPPADGHPEMRFHLAFEGKPGTPFQLRQMKLRPANPEEKRLAANRDQIQAARAADAEAILTDLRATYPASIDTVHVGLHEITLIGKAPATATATAPMRLIGIPPESPSHSASANSPVITLQPDAQGHFKLNLPRTTPDSPRDRALWRWRLADADGMWTSAAKWPTAYGPAVARKLPRLTAPHPKGIGMPPITDPNHDIFDLGIRHATVNVVLHALIRDTPAPGWTPWDFEGLTYHLNEKALQRHDATLRLLAARDIIATAILLVGNGRQPDGTPHTTLTHPEAEARGIYSIPNLTAPDPAQFYRAALHLMAERWTREDGANGRFSNWILHNEIDQAATWTNMGAQPLARYLETYMRSARLMYHSARLFDPHARVFISLTHHWAKKSSGHGTYIVRDILDLFAAMGRTEGDFEWGVAYHPYPRDLRNPDTWNDADLTDDFDTPYITPKNIAVLPAYLDQPRFHFQGRPRGILLSEQGFNTPTLSIEDQRRQVAGLIYMFRKLAPLKTIEAYHLHRYQDMPVQEGNLRLGIITETGEHKLGWRAYQAIGTPQETEFAEIADQVILAPKP
jgi:hypothetical protein